MVENSTSDEDSKTNKGVNVHSASLPAPVHRHAELLTSSSATTSNRSTRDIRNEIQNVLDLMGPSTAVNTSSEADNEDSVLSVIQRTETRSSRVSSRDKKSPSTPLTVSTYSSNRKVKLCSVSNTTNKDSVMADIGTYSNNVDSSEEYELSCCDHTRACFNPECMCHMKHEEQTAPPEGFYPSPNRSTKVATVDCRKRGLLDWIKNRSLDLMLKKSNYDPRDLYRINICGQDEDGCPPKRVVFDLVEGIPKPSAISVATNTIRNPVEKYKTNNSQKSDEMVTNCPCKEAKNLTNQSITQGYSKVQKNIFYDSEGNTRVDYYYFDHGNAHYFHTTDTPPVMKCEIIAEKTERYTTRFWAEFFASIHIGVSFCVSFILQLFKFLLYSIFRPLCVGLTQMWSDYLFKPFLTTFFNGLIQPFLIFLYNIATSLRDLCDPIAEAFGYFCRELAVLFRAIRLCTYKKNSGEDITNCGCVPKRKCEC